MISIRAALRDARVTVSRHAASLRSWADAHPIATNAVIYGGLYTLAEISQQKIRKSATAVNTAAAVTPAPYSAAPKLVSLPASAVAGHTQLHPRDLSPVKAHGPIDMSSVKRYAIMGTVVFPPILTKWYTWLDNRFPCTSRSVVMKKLVLDQFLLTPWMVAIFFIGMSFMEGKKGLRMLDECKEKFLKTFTLDCCYWLPVQALNFLFIPPVLRVAYIGVTTFIWLNVLCYIKAGPH